MTTLYLSHSGLLGELTDDAWWVVEPRNDPHRLAAQIHDLLSVGRRVIAVSLPDDTDPRREPGTTYDVELSTVPWPRVEF